jgi:hypothetical protein
MELVIRCYCGMDLNVEKTKLVRISVQPSLEDYDRLQTAGDCKWDDNIKMDQEV